MEGEQQADEEYGGEDRQEDEPSMVQCNACGTKFAGVSEKECKRWMANHVLGEHEDEAPEPVLEEARDRLEAMEA